MPVIHTISDRDNDPLHVEFDEHGFSLFLDEDPFAVLRHHERLLDAEGARELRDLLTEYLDAE